MAELYDTSILLWNNSHMKGLVAAAIVAASLSPARAEQPPANRTAQAYEQFLLAHHLEASDDVDGAVAAFQRAMTLDPKAADIPMRRTARRIASPGSSTPRWPIRIAAPGARGAARRRARI